MLEFDGLHKSFGDNHVLDGVGFTVPPGSMFGFAGPTGPARRRRCASRGPRPCRRRRGPWRGRPLDLETRRRIGYMPEERGLYPKMGVGEQVTYFARLHGLSAAERRPAVAEWVERLGLGERRGDPVEKLSLGNQQRVQLAAALVSRPEVLILDEPFSGLDPIGVDWPSPRRCSIRPPGRPGRSSPATSSTSSSGSATRRHPRPRPHGRRRPVEDLRRRETAGCCASSSRTPPAWAAELPGVRVVSEQAGDTLLELTAGTDDQAVLAAALRTGRVTHFAWRGPRSSSCSARPCTQAPAGGGGSPHARQRAMVRLVAAGDLRPGPGQELHHQLDRDPRCC